MRHLAGALGAVAILLVTGTPTAAQVVETGAKGGINLASLSSFGEPGGTTTVDPDWRTGLAVGGFTHVRITDRVGFQPELMLSVNGAMIATTGGEATIELVDLEIPLMLKLQGASTTPVSFYAVVGVTPLFNLDATVSVGDDHSADVDDSVKRSDVGLTVGSGIQGRHWLLEARFTQGVRDIAQEELALDRPARRRAFAVLAGWRF